MKKISKDILCNLKEGYLEPKFDSAKSFYNKAMTDESDSKLYSYGTLVAEVVDDKPVIYNAQSHTTVRHIKEFLRQKGFEDSVIVKAIKDFKNKDKVNESVEKADLITAEDTIKTLEDKDANIKVKVIKANNGKFFNYYYSSDMEHWDSTAGPFKTAEEAIEMAKKHRPSAKEIKESALPIDDMQEYEVYDYAMKFMDSKEVDFDTKMAINKLLNRIDNANRRGTGYSQKATNDLRNLLKDLESKVNLEEAFDTIQYWGSKNQFGYTIRQLRVDYENKTYETGSFKQSVDHKVSNKEIDRKMEELDALGFTNLNKQHAEKDLERTEELYKNTPDEKHRQDYESAKFNAKRYGVTKESEEKPRRGKTKLVYVLQGKYDSYWEDLVEYENYKEAKEDYKAYQENEREYPHRIIQRRVPRD